MLVLREKGSEGAGWTGVYVVDFHHHIGKNNSVKNLSPSAPDGTFSFLREVLFGNQWKPGFFKELRDNPDRYKFDIPEDFNKATAPSPPAADIIKAAGPAAAGMENSFAVDQVVAFPMDDTYCDKEIEHYRTRNLPTPKYALSNSRLAQIVHRFPNSLRFVGFGRVFPQDFGACDEVERMAGDLGLRGLKLHPKSEFFELEGEGFKNIIRTCAGLDIPIILHTSSLSDVRKIYDSVNEVVAERFKAARGRSVAAIRSELMRIKVVIGHCGWHASPDLYDILSHPNLHGEISGIRSQGADRFFSALKEGFDQQFFFNEGIPAIAGRRDKRSRLYKVYGQNGNDTWSRKVMYGSDFPFMDHNQSIDVFASMFSTEFPGDIRDIRRVLGLNALSLLGRRLPVSDRVGPQQSYAPAVSTTHSVLASEVLLKLKTGFESLVLSPHLDERGNLDWISYDLLDDQGGVQNLVLTCREPAALLPEDGRTEAVISALHVNPSEMPPRKGRTRKLGKKELAALLSINKGISKDFELD